MAMTNEQRDRQLIERVYGNIGIENPNITREFVAEVLKKWRAEREQKTKDAPANPE